VIRLSSGKLRSSSGKLRSSSGKLRSSSGKLRSSSGKLRSSSGKLRSSSGKLMLSLLKVVDAETKIRKLVHRQYLFSSDIAFRTHVTSHNLKICCNQKKSKNPKKSKKSKIKNQKSKHLTSQNLLTAIAGCRFRSCIRNHSS
jgi:hypothetical protein